MTDKKSTKIGSDGLIDFSGFERASKDILRPFDTLNKLSKDPSEFERLKAKVKNRARDLSL